MKKYKETTIYKSKFTDSKDGKFWKKPANLKPIPAKVQNDIEILKSILIISDIFWLNKR